AGRAGDDNHLVVHRSTLVEESPEKSGLKRSTCSVSLAAQPLAFQPSCACGLTAVFCCAAA
ncbi:MAG: hypothetical protein ABI256_06185, partial [Rhodoferax sp.]